MMKGSRSQQSSPATSSSSSLASQGMREPSDNSDDQSPSQMMAPPSTVTSRVSAVNVTTTTISNDSAVTILASSGGNLGKDKFSSSPQDHLTLASVDSKEQAVLLDSRAECSSPTYSELPELNPVRPLILHHPHMVIEGVGSGEESSMSWLYDFYPNVLGSSPKDDLESYVEQSVSGPSGGNRGSGGPSLEQQQQQSDFGHDPRQTIFRAQERYVVTLGAPISIAQRMNEDTLTYLNKGQFYSLYVCANTRMSIPRRVRTVIGLTFFDEADRKVEFQHWQYWYNLQANPNQKAFDIDRKNCENIHEKVQDLAYNAASFIWSPEMGAKIVLRINCLSTEFSSQKGVKGIPLYLVTDTYEDLDNLETADPVHRAFCKIKIFRDKGAERKNKDETKSVERRIQKYMKKQSGGVLESEGASTMFHPPNKETVLTSTSTLGPKPFLFLPQQTVHHSTKVVGQPSNFLATIKERETKRTFSRALKQAKEDFGALEVETDDTPPKKAAKIPNHQMTTVYVRKKEEDVYNALLLDSLTVHDFKLQVAKKYNVPADMIKDVLKRTKKGLLVHFDDDMISRFQDEDDFIIDLTFDNQKGCFNLLIHY